MRAANRALFDSQFRFPLDDLQCRCRWLSTVPRAPSTMRTLTGVVPTEDIPFANVRLTAKRAAKPRLRRRRADDTVGATTRSAERCRLYFARKRLFARTISKRSEASDWRHTASRRRRTASRPAGESRRLRHTGPADEVATRMPRANKHTMHGGSQGVLTGVAADFTAACNTATALASCWSGGGLASRFFSTDWSRRHSNQASRSAFVHFTG